jgi:hypothetical protein
MSTHKGSIKEIAKQVRADIKAAKKKGEMHYMTKVSVRIQRYSMGRALLTTITELSGPVYNIDWILFKQQHPNDWWTREDVPEKYSLEAWIEKKRIDEIVARYNWDKSDAQTDYYNVNFAYGGCDFDSDLSKRDMDKQLVQYRVEHELGLSADVRSVSPGTEVPNIRVVDYAPDEDDIADGRMTDEQYRLHELEQNREAALEKLQEATAAYDHANDTYQKAVQVETLREAARTAQEVADKHLADAKELERALCDRLN